LPQSFDISTATVLGKEVRGEDMLHVTAFSDTLGALLFIKKISSQKTSQQPDLFDDISGTADAPQSAEGSTLRFLRDFEITRRRAGIAKSYDALEQASMLAQCAAKNGRHVENCAKLSARLRRALDAMDAGAPPHVVSLKFMYLFARDEGYPIIEDFFNGLSEPKRALFSALVKTPAGECAELSTRAVDMLEEMCRWIYAETDIIE